MVGVLNVRRHQADADAHVVSCLQASFADDRRVGVTVCEVARHLLGTRAALPAQPRLDGGESFCQLSCWRCSRRGAFNRVAQMCAGRRRFQPAWGLLRSGRLQCCEDALACSAGGIGR